MGQEVVFVGAGHAHLKAISNLHHYICQGGHATVIHPDEYLYYTNMGVGMLSGMYLPKEVRFNIKRLTLSHGGIFIQDHVVKVDPIEHELILSKGKKITYDVASFGIGSEIAVGAIDTSYTTVFKAKPVEQLFLAGCAIIDTLKKTKETIHIVIVGGGASGIEIVNNVWQITSLYPEQVKITLVTRHQILPGWSPRTRKIILNRLLNKGITVETNMPVKGNTARKFLLEDGRELPFDIAIVATGLKAPDLFARSGIPTGKNGRLLVNQFLQSVRYPTIFGGGDCICFESHSPNHSSNFTKHQNHILYENLDAALLGTTLKPFIPPKQYTQILNLGDGTGVFNSKLLTFCGKLAFTLKNYHDRKFMDEFQLSGELEEGLYLD